MRCLGRQLVIVEVLGDERYIDEDKVNGEVFLFSGPSLASVLSH